MIFANGFRGVLTAQRVPTGETVNKEYYKMYIRTILRPAIRRKRQEMIYRTSLILHDNASPHKANVINELLESYQWEVLDHCPPPPSHDLRPHPPEFDLFPKLKKPLRVIRYESLDELECTVNREVRRINFGNLATGIQALPKRWNSVIQSRGDYFGGS